MTLLEFVILGLATWRVSALFSREAGPFDVFKRTREWAGITHDNDGNVQVIPHKFFAELLSCVWCTSIWVAAFWAALWMLLPHACLAIALLFALSGLAIFADRLS